MKRFFLKYGDSDEVFQSLPTAEQPENSVPIIVGVNDGFTRPKFDQWPNPTAVVEGYTDDIFWAENTEILMIKLQETAADLRIRAKKAAIDKTGSDSYIFSQVELYELKFKVASGEIVSDYMTSLLTNEAQEFGLEYADFCALIISMYENAKTTYEVFLLMIERCRTKIQTLIENQQRYKVAQAFMLVETLNDAAQAQGLMESILEL